MDIKKLLGIKVTDDTNREEKSYYFGSDNQMPLGLFLAVGSGYNEGLERFCSLFTYTGEAQNWAKEITSSNDLEGMVKKLVEAFEYVEPTPLPPGMVTEVNGVKTFNLNKLTPVSADWKEKLMNPPYDAVLPFHVYAEQFAKILVMRTPQYGSGREGVIMTCPMSYIKFWGREEFNMMTKAIDGALEHTVREVIRVMDIQGMKLDKDTMTVHVEGYKPFVGVYGYGW